MEIKTMTQKEALAYAYDNYSKGTIVQPVHNDGTLYGSHYKIETDKEPYVYKNSGGDDWWIISQYNLYSNKSGTWAKIVGCESDNYEVF